MGKYNTKHELGGNDKAVNECNADTNIHVENALPVSIVCNIHF